MKENKQNEDKMIENKSAMRKKMWRKSNKTGPKQAAKSLCVLVQAHVSKRPCDMFAVLFCPKTKPYPCLSVPKQDPSHLLTINHLQTTFEVHTSFSH